VVRGDDIETKIGMALHIIFKSMAKSVRDFGGTHVVICMDGKSWRRDIYPQYKLRRRENSIALNKSRTESETADEIKFEQAYRDFASFLEDETNCTVLQHNRCEADDFIARWVQNHPDHKHIIISSDSDFYQLISENVSQYNGITGEHMTLYGTFDDRGRPVIDKKSKKQKQIDDPEYILFEKCIRGDSTDGIFSAYPRAPKKGSKNRTGILDAFADRNKKGFDYNNFMLQTWVDHDDVEHRVIDRYELNRKLIDLTAQPLEIQQYLDSTIIETTQKEPVKQVGIRFMKFCGKYDLQKLSDNPVEHAAYLGATY